VHVLTVCCDLIMTTRDINKDIAYSAV